MAMRGESVEAITEGTQKRMGIGGACKPIDAHSLKVEEFYFTSVP